MSTTESDSTNPYQSPDSHVAAVSTASEVQANPTRRLVHPLNFVILGGLIFIWWLLSDESLASLVRCNWVMSTTTLPASPPPNVALATIAWSNRRVPVPGSLSRIVMPPAEPLACVEAETRDLPLKLPLSIASSMAPPMPACVSTITTPLFRSRRWLCR